MCSSLSPFFSRPSDVSSGPDIDMYPVRARGGLCWPHESGLWPRWLERCLGGRGRTRGRWGLAAGGWWRGRCPPRRYVRRRRLLGNGGGSDGFHCSPRRCRWCPRLGRALIGDLDSGESARDKQNTAMGFFTPLAAKAALALQIAAIFGIYLGCGCE